MLSTIAVLTTFAVHLDAAALESEARTTTAPEDPAVPEGTVGAADPASAGSTEVEGQGQFAATSEDSRHAEDATELELSAGGLMATGNAFAIALTGQGRFRLRRGIHQLSVQAAGNYGYAEFEQELTRYRLPTPAPGNPPIPASDAIGEVTTDTVRDTTVANLQGMARYDVFFARRWSAFLMGTLRRDRFQGLDLRLNVDPGVAFYALTEPRHRLWFEVGYDLQYDARRREAVFAEQLVDPLVDADANGFADTELVRIADDSLLNHATRLFAGYNNSLSDRISLDIGLEYLQSVLVARRFRLNWINALNIQLGNRFGLGFTYTLRYENDPLPGIAKLDTVTAILLTLRFI